MEDAAATPNESHPLTPHTSTHIPPHTTHTPHYRHYTPPHAAPSPRTRNTNVNVTLEEERENEVARERGKVRGERDNPPPSSSSNDAMTPCDSNDEDEEEEAPPPPPLPTSAPAYAPTYAPTYPYPAPTYQYPAPPRALSNTSFLSPTPYAPPPRTLQRLGVRGGEQCEAGGARAWCAGLSEEEEALLAELGQEEEARGITLDNIQDIALLSEMLREAGDTHTQTQPTQHCNTEEEERVRAGEERVRAGEQRAARHRGDGDGAGRAGGGGGGGGGGEVTVTWCPPRAPSEVGWVKGKAKEEVCDVIVRRVDRMPKVRTKPRAN